MGDQPGGLAAGEHLNLAALHVAARKAVQPLGLPVADRCFVPPAAFGHQLSRGVLGGQLLTQRERVVGRDGSRGPGACAFPASIGLLHAITPDTPQQAILNRQDALNAVAGAPTAERQQPVASVPRPERRLQVVQLFGDDFKACACRIALALKVVAVEGKADLGCAGLVFLKGFQQFRARDRAAENIAEHRDIACIRRDVVENEAIALAVDRAQATPHHLDVQPVRARRPCEMNAGNLGHVQPLGPEAAIHQNLIAARAEVGQQLTAHGLVRRAVSGHSGVARRAKCLSQRIRARDRHGEGNRRTIGGILFMGSDDHLAARLGVEAIGQRLLLEVTRDGLHASEVDLGGNRVPGRLDQIALPHQIGNRDRERGGGEAVGHRLAVAALRRGRHAQMLHGRVGVSQAVDDLQIARADRVVRLIGDQVVDRASGKQLLQVRVDPLAICIFPPIPERLHGGHDQLTVVVFLLAEQPADARAVERAIHQPITGHRTQALNRLRNQFFAVRQNQPTRAIGQEFGQQLDEDHGLARAGGCHAQHVGVLLPGGQGLSNGLGLVVTKLHL